MEWHRLWPKEFIHRNEWLIQNNGLRYTELATWNLGSLMATASYDLFRMYCLIADVKLNIKAAGQARDDAATENTAEQRKQTLWPFQVFC